MSKADARKELDDSTHFYVLDEDVEGLRRDFDSWRATAKSILLASFIALLSIAGSIILLFLERSTS